MISILSTLLVSAIFTCLSPIAALATTPTYDAIYVFGDSYCDVGNIFALTTADRRPNATLPPYFHGRFSNGPLWVEHIASSMGLPMTPPVRLARLRLRWSRGNSTGSPSAGHDPQRPPTGPALPQSTTAAKLTRTPSTSSKAAATTSSTPPVDRLNPSDSRSHSASPTANSCFAAGAKNFLIPNLFDISLLPVGRANAAFAQQASLAANKSLNHLLALEQLLQGIEIRRIDVFDLLQSVASDATHFGFTDIVHPCINPITSMVCTDPDHTFFWDIYHPTVLATFS